MKRLIFFFVGCGALLSVLSFIGKEATPGVGLSPGSKFPQIQLTDSVYGSFDLAAQEGKYVVLNFWASYDALSRMSDIRLKQAVDRLERDDVAYISVSFDRSPVVFEETILADGCTASHYFDRRGTDSDVYEKAGLKTGFNNFLLDPQGVIIAKNVDPEKLKTLI